ncbi:hypothetical protein Atep_11100 [Allochromatium tepidum]|uniref:Uncharacterized protein n=1 Tax=Allochromatium tepidum TaxID=553982 RepID=A0ABN6G9V0_9GAMM|nr:hypothetical protein Atep_11100 [Allochromatium tepidum]
MIRPKRRRNPETTTCRLAGLALLYRIGTLPGRSPARLPVLALYRDGTNRA